MKKKIVERDELSDFIMELYRHLRNRVAFDERLHPDLTVWESVEPRLLTGIRELNGLRGPATEMSKTSSLLPSVAPIAIKTDNWGDTGLARYVLEVRQAPKGPITSLVRVTDVLRRSQFGWQIVHHHAQDLSASFTE